jgi:hypothetical protein
MGKVTTGIRRVAGIFGCAFRHLSPDPDLTIIKCHPYSHVEYGVPGVEQNRPSQS